jgi:adenylylsulfate kinase
MKKNVWWLTGLPAAGKTTLAQALCEELKARAAPVYHLDGDVLRQGLCSDLGMSAVDRQENIRRAGAVARLMADAGLHVVCSFVSPFAVDRQRVRALFEPGQFVEVYLSTSLEACMQRDPKQLYAKARAGELLGLTGWDAPYEVPDSPEFMFDTSAVALDEMVKQVLLNKFITGR